MRMTARPATDQDISQAVVASGVDVPQLDRDLDARDDEIVALLKRNIAEADALKLQGTPVLCDRAVSGILPTRCGGV